MTSTQHDPASKQHDPASPVSYESAIAEVEEILAELEGNVTDVDHLADRVRRASELLTLCRDRLAVVKEDVGQLVMGLDDPEATD